ncbi:hypothetical protein PBR20603_02851 [Pandoraea bronchicola]|uniref:Uncharacterized protein n=1 Tax=Pandoraea bronchicola TaxID=2508287 RepID=A0A5E5BU01_9BURK|nr:hypothetical protein PBR20603_02851 [Pandoraea bronchicola]
MLEFGVDDRKVSLTIIRDERISAKGFLDIDVPQIRQAHPLEPRASQRELTSSMINHAALVHRRAVRLKHAGILNRRAACARFLEMRAPAGHHDGARASAGALFESKVTTIGNGDGGILRTRARVEYDGSAFVGGARLDRDGLRRERPIEDFRSARATPGHQHNALGRCIDTLAVRHKVERSLGPHGNRQLAVTFNALMDIQRAIDNAHQMGHVFRQTNRADISDAIRRAAHGIRRSA